MNTYYSRIANSLTRADIFLSHIPYSIVKEKIYYELIDAELCKLLAAASASDDIVSVKYYSALISNEQYHLDIIKEKYPDTYNFLMSLNDHRATIAEY